MSILAQYVDNVLSPIKKELQFIKSGVKSIRNVLTQNSSLPPKEVHLGGSFAKGTMLRHNLDADIVFLYNKSAEAASDWRKLVTIVYKPLKSNFPLVEVEEAGNVAIHIKTSLDNRPVNFDIVSGYFVNSPKQMKDHTTSKLYTANTTVWHTRYLQRYKNLPYFTHIVRLLKDWKDEQDVPALKSIHLELIAADVYDNIVDDINDPGEIEDVLTYSFENIIDTLDGYPVIPSRWRYCNEDDYKEQYDLPVLIDPANPNDNLLDNLTKADTKKIRRKTEITMENIKESNYANIFNRKGGTDFFDG